MSGVTVSNVVSASALVGWATSLLQAWGFRGDDAGFLADTLVDANLRGIDSHGVVRLPAYYDRIKAGLIDPAAVPVVSATGAVAQVDASRASGQVAALAAMRAVAASAGEFGVGMVTVRGSAHFGTAGYYARALARQNMVALVCSNSEPAVVRFGGTEAALGTNPFSFATPAEPHPICLDMATSTAAMGKVMIARERGDSIPPDWGVDSQGNPVTDPDAVHALLPFGGAKGYGISLMIEVLAGVLSGAAISREIGNMYSDFDKPQNVGHWFLAIDVNHLGLATTFTERIADLAREMESTPAVVSSRPVVMPGAPEEITRTTRVADGIPLSRSVLKSLDDLSVSADVSTVSQWGAA